MNTSKNQNAITQFDFASRTKNLTNKNMHNRLIFNSNFAGCNLSGSDMSHGSFVFCNFAGANLTGVNLTGANLAFSDLTGANLTNANLYYANLIGARLNEVTLSNIQIEGVILAPDETLVGNTLGTPVPTAELLCSKYNICYDIPKSSPVNSVTITGVINEQRIDNIGQPQQQQNAQPWVNPLNIHVAFDSIGIDKLNNKLAAILTDKNINNPESYYVGLDTTQYIADGLKRIMSNTGLTKYNQDIDKLTQLMSRFNFSQFQQNNADKLNSLKVLFGRTVDYLGLQSRDFVDNYLQALIRDSLFAYGTNNNPSASCPRGVMERVVLNMVDALTAECSVNCDVNNRDLLAIFVPPASNSGDTIETLANQWWQQFNDNDAPQNSTIQSSSVINVSNAKPNSKPNNTENKKFYNENKKVNNENKKVNNENKKVNNENKKNSKLAVNQTQTVNTRTSKRQRFMQEYGNAASRKQKFVNNMTAKGIPENAARKYVNNKIGYAFNQMEI